MITAETQDKKQSTLSCPVDLVKVDENRVRVVAFFVLIFALFYIINDNLLIIGILLADFLLRALNLNAGSPLALISGAVVKQIGLKPKPVDRAPKRFAAFTGVGFLCVILIAGMAHGALLSKVITGVLAVFASMESFAGICAGCYVYKFIVRFGFAG